MVDPQRRMVYAVVCVLLLAALVWAFLARSPAFGVQRFKVRVTTLASTNDASGARHATFLIANEGRRPVLLCPMYGFENQSGRWRSELVPKVAAVVGTNLEATLPGTGKRLDPGQTNIVTLVLPFDDVSWRAHFTYLELWRPLEAAMDDARRFAHLRRTNNHNRFVQTFTDWTQ